MATAIIITLAALAQAPGQDPPPPPPAGDVVCVVDAWWFNSDGSMEMFGRIYWQVQTTHWRRFSVSLENCGWCFGCHDEENTSVNEWDIGSHVGFASGMIWWSFTTHPDSAVPAHCDFGQQLITSLWWIDPPEHEPHYGVAADYDSVRF